MPRHTANASAASRASIPVAHAPLEAELDDHRHECVERQRNLGELEGAIASYSRATELLERHLGAKHPRLVFMGQKYAAALALAGRHEEARVELERSLAIGLTDEGTTPDDIADIRFALARSLWALGE